MGDWNYIVPTSLEEVAKVLRRRIEVHLAWAEYLEANAADPDAQAAIAAGIGQAENHRLYASQYEAAISLLPLPANSLA